MKYAPETGSVKVRCPLRICLGGGGSDLPEYWRRFGGFVLTATIDKYLTVEIGRGEPHRYAAAAGWAPDTPVTVTSDVPAGSGMGSSGALMVALVKARWPELSGHELAQASYNAERYVVGQRCGVQDHYAAAIGGSMALSVTVLGYVAAPPIRLPDGFEERLCLFRMPITRDAGKVLKSQSDAVSVEGRAEEAMVRIMGIGIRIHTDLGRGGANFGQLTDEHWMVKRIFGVTTTPQIDQWHELAMAHGAEGGKVVGAGAGGHLLIVTDPNRRVEIEQVMSGAGLELVPFRFVNERAEVVR